MNTRLFRELYQLFDDLEQDDNVKSVVITGAC
jgi:enoyl-CoA hydratase/carnithine racemase